MRPCSIIGRWSGVWPGIAPEGFWSSSDPVVRHCLSRHSTASDAEALGDGLLRALALFMSRDHTLAYVEREYFHWGRHILAKKS